MTDYSIFFIIAVVATGVGALLFLLSLFGLGEHDLDLTLIHISEPTRPRLIS